MKSSTAVAVVAVFLIGACKREGAGPGGAPGVGGPAGRGPERRVPVLVEAAATRDLPIILEGLGTVTPLATVQVKSQVDGRLISVSFKEGAAVRKGDVLAQVDPRPFQIALAQSAATLDRDRAQLRNARLLLERNTQLRAANLVSQQAVDDQQTLVDQLEATLGIDRAVHDNAALQLEYSRIVAPVDGVMGLRQIDPGNLVRAADTSGLGVLTQLDPIAVVFTVPQDDLGRVARALASGPLAVEAWSRDGRTLLAKGSLSVIDNQINTATATVRLKAIFPNATRALWPNLFVKARVAVDRRVGAVVVQAAAIQRGPQGAFVYLAAADRTAQLRPVEVDLIEGPLAVVKEGLAAGDVVITDGQTQLRPGSPIEPRTLAAPVEPRGHP